MIWIEVEVMFWVLDPNANSLKYRSLAAMPVTLLKWVFPLQWYELNPCTAELENSN